jgi:hypothetical protein
MAAFLRYSDIDPKSLPHCETPLMLSDVCIPRRSTVNSNHAFSDHSESHAIVARRDPTSRKIDPDRILDLHAALRYLRHLGIL